MSNQKFEQRESAALDVIEESVAVMFAESRSEADECRSMLELNGIQAVVEGAAERRRRSAGIAVLVPAGQLDEASSLLAASELTAGLLSDARNDLKAGPRDDDDDVDAVDDEDDFDDDDDDDDDDLLADDDDEDDDFDDADDEP